MSLFLEVVIILFMNPKFPNNSSLKLPWLKLRSVVHHSKPINHFILHVYYIRNGFFAELHALLHVLDSPFIYLRHKSLSSFLSSYMSCAQHLRQRYAQNIGLHFIKHFRPSTLGIVKFLAEMIF
jgi:hypothetical protein